MEGFRWAAFERDYLLVDVTEVMCIAAWVPDGFRPWWLLFAAGAAGWLVVGALRFVGRGFDRLADAAGERRRGRTVSGTDESVTLRRTFGGRALASAAWSDVTAAFVYKRDLVTTDLVCLALETGTGLLELDESMTGWSDVVAALPDRLAGCEPVERWYLQTVRRPFEPSLRQIYGPPRAADLLARIDADDDACDDAPPVTRWSGVRDYLAHGTLSIFAAVAAGLAAVGAYQRSAGLIATAGVVALYLLATRLAGLALILAYGRRD